ncbi:hypothetical protein LTR15_010348 [Elasticomyces elasticus]|nr:hypothetical protein LTR15_010348 [Elasticomyces elasticus]
MATTTYGLYERLDASRMETRLVILKKAEYRTDDLHCELRKVALAGGSKPYYETLSYVWGDVTTKCDIFLHGQRTAIGASAAQVLRQFRGSGRDRILWLDQVSINQADDVERSQQVAIMGEIYANSAHGFVWLTPDSNILTEARSSLDAVLENACNSTGQLARLRETLYDDMHGPHMSDRPLPASVASGLEVLFKIFDQPWFLRLWVVQEAALPKASTAYCGDVGVALRELLICAAWLRYKWVYLPKFAARHVGLACAAVIFDYADNKYGWFAERYATRPCLSGLMKVLQDATRLAIVERGASDIGFSLVDILNHPGDLDKHDWPSWVPRWNRPWDEDRDPASIRNDYRAGGTGTIDLLSSPNAQTSILGLRGLVVSSVQVRSPTWTADDLSQVDVVSRRVEHFRQLIAKQHNVGDSALAMTLVAGLDYMVNPCLAQSAIRRFAAYYGFVERSEDHPRIHNLDPGCLAPEDDTRLAAEYGQAMYTACKSRRLIITADGRPGLGPQVLECDDVVAILYGSIWPVILRPMHEEDHYQLCGIAYVDGIMDGKWAEAQKTKGRNDDSFYLH